MSSTSFNPFTYSTSDSFEQERAIKPSDTGTPTQTPILGYLTYKKIDDETAPKMFEGLKSSEEKVQDGYGEYIVFQRETTKKQLSQECYHLAYAVLNKFAHIPLPDEEIRSEIIHKKIQEIDPSLEITFIPRTLYDMIFLRAGIEEDMQAHSVCPLESKTGSTILQEQLNEDPQNQNILKSKQTCWHLCDFNELNPGTNDLSDVELLAYRLNNLIIEKLNPNGFFSGREIEDFLDNQIHFFQDHARNFKGIFTSEKFSTIEHPRERHCTLDFAGMNFWSREEDLKIENNIDAIVFHHAIALECNQLARNAFILYRAGNFSEERFVRRQVTNWSLSYGKSMLSGALRDLTATVYYHTKVNKRDTYAVIVPFNEYESSPYYVPQTHAIIDLCSQGETFHPRSKIIAPEPNVRIAGSSFDSGDKHLPYGLIYPFEGDMVFEASQKLKASLSSYHAKAILLTPFNPPLA